MPPPPPPIPPPAPALPNFSSSSSSTGGGHDPRDQLLNSIRQGKALKKTVINDRSAPLVDGEYKILLLYKRIV